MFGLLIFQLLGLFALPFLILERVVSALFSG